MQWNGKRVFITGVTGLLGSHLTKYLLGKGAEIVALVRDHTPNSLFFSEDSKWNLKNKVNIVYGEVEDFRLLERTLNEYEIDSVFHLAAQAIVGTANRSPLMTFKTNIEGTWNILEAVRLHQKQIERVVVASSDKAYGNLKGQAYDESFPLQGEHPYDVSKSCADLIAQSFAKSYHLPIAITRCGNFFGPGDLNLNRLIPGTIVSVLENKPPTIRSDGNFVRDYIFVEDGAHAYTLLAEWVSELNLQGEAFNFSYGLKLTVAEVVEKILNCMGKPELKPIILNQATNEIPIQSLDSTKAKKILHWKPLYGFEDGLKETIGWYSKFLKK